MKAIKSKNSQKWFTNVDSKNIFGSINTINGSNGYGVYSSTSGGCRLCDQEGYFPCLYSSDNFWCYDESGHQIIITFDANHNCYEAKSGGCFYQE